MPLVMLHSNRRGSGPTIPPVAEAAFYSINGVVPFVGNEGSWPSAVYSASQNKTYIVFQRIAPRERSVASVVAYNHTTETFGLVYDIAPWAQPDTLDGQPVIEIDGDGYLWVFYRAVNSFLGRSRSTNPYDESLWTGFVGVTENLAFTKPILVGSDMYLFNRLDLATQVKRTLVMRSGTPTAGTLTFGPRVDLVDFSFDTQIFASAVHELGGKIHVAFIVSDAGDNNRRDVWYFVYNPTLDQIETIDGGATIAAASLPMTSADTAFRVRQTSGGGNRIGEVSFQLDAIGNSHLLYPEGTGPFDLKHTWHNGTGWQTNTLPVQVAKDDPTAGQVRHIALVPTGGTTLEAWYPQDPIPGETRGGDTMHRILWNGSGWSSPQEMGNGDGLSLANPTAVRNGSSGLRMLYSEVRPDADFANAEPLEIYAHGAAGYIDPATPVFPRYDVGSDFVRLQVADDGTIQDVAWGFFDSFVTNNVSVSGSDMIYDGTSSYVDFDNSSLWGIPGDFTLIVEVEFNVELSAPPGNYGIAGYGNNINGNTSMAWKLQHTGTAWSWVTTDDGVGVFTERLAFTAARVTGSLTTFAVERKGSDLRFFLNNLTSGNEVASATWSGVPQGLVAPMTLGADFNTAVSGNYRRHVHGSFRLFRMANEALITA